MEHYKKKIKKYEIKILKGGHFLNYYDNYITFYNNSILNYDYSAENIKKVETLGSGAFGKTYRINFKNLTSSTVLKINTRDNNLYFEFICGLCINEIKKYLPNFVFTLNLYKYQDKDTIEKLLDNNNIVIPLENTKLLNKEYNFFFENKKFHEYKNTCLLIEEITGDTVYSKKNEIEKESCYNQYTIIFQIYAALFATRKKFSHYDLHLGNVILYKCEIPIKIIYSNGIIIYAKYIPIIIDYGKSYFYIDENYNSSKLDTGMFRKHKNESIDLRFFHLFSDIIRPSKELEESFEVIKLYLDENINFDDIGSEQKKYKDRRYIRPLEFEKYKEYNGIINKGDFYSKFTEIIGLVDVFYEGNSEMLQIIEGRILNVEQLFDKLKDFHYRMKYDDYKIEEHNKTMKIDLDMKNEIVFL